MDAYQGLDTQVLKDRRNKYQEILLPKGTLKEEIKIIVQGFRVMLGIGAIVNLTEVYRRRPSSLVLERGGMGDVGGSDRSGYAALAVVGRCGGRRRDGIPAESPRRGRAARPRAKGAPCRPGSGRRCGCRAAARGRDRPGPGRVPDRRRPASG